ncbi:MAG: RNA-binding domain-containing protein [Planctomycetota bacterium]
MNVEKDPRSREFIEDFQEPEQDSLDFKALPLKEDLPVIVRRLVKDIAAMANSGGGWLVVGRNQKEKKLPGAPESLVKADDSDILNGVGKYLSVPPTITKMLVAATDPTEAKEVVCVTLHVGSYKEFPCVVSSVVDVPDEQKPDKQKTEARQGDVFIREHKASVRVDSEQKLRQLFHPSIVRQARNLVTEVLGIVAPAPSSSIFPPPSPQPHSGASSVPVAPQDLIEKWHEESKLRVRVLEHFRANDCYSYFWFLPEDKDKHSNLRSLDDACEKACPGLIPCYGDRHRTQNGIQWELYSAFGFIFHGFARLEADGRFFTCVSVFEDNNGRLLQIHIMDHVARCIGLVAKLASELGLGEKGTIRVDLAPCTQRELNPNILVVLPRQYICYDESVSEVRDIRLPRNGNEHKPICEDILSSLFENFRLDGFRLDPGKPWWNEWARVAQDVVAQQGFYTLRGN